MSKWTDHNGLPELVAGDWFLDEAAGGARLRPAGEPAPDVLDLDVDDILDGIDVEEPEQ